eukprot:1132935-Amphidinium_carterae.1
MLKNPRKKSQNVKKRKLRTERFRKKIPLVAVLVFFPNLRRSSLLNAVTRTMRLAPAAFDPGVTRSLD